MVAYTAGSPEKSVSQGIYVRFHVVLKNNRFLMGGFYNETYYLKGSFAKNSHFKMYLQSENVFFFFWL